jgi:hypothetical protein
MATAADVLSILIPSGGWVSYGNEYEDIQFLECEPISKKDFEAGMAQYDALLAAKQQETAAKKSALLQRLGITQEEASLLLS